MNTQRKLWTRILCGILVGTMLISAAALVIYALLGLL